MSSSNLIRSGGLATLLAGALMIVLTIVMFVDPIDPAVSYKAPSETIHG